MPVVRVVRCGADLLNVRHLLTATGGEGKQRPKAPISFKFQIFNDEVEL